MGIVCQCWLGATLDSRPWMMDRSAHVAQVAPVAQPLSAEGAEVAVVAHKGGVQGRVTAWLLLIWVAASARGIAAGVVLHILSYSAFFRNREWLLLPPYTERVQLTTLLLGQDPRGILSSQSTPKVSFLPLHSTPEEFSLSIHLEVLSTPQITIRLSSPLPHHTKHSSSLYSQRQSSLYFNHTQGLWTLCSHQTQHSNSLLYHHSHYPSSPYSHHTWPLFTHTQHPQALFTLTTLI